jgi:hypothetical protein
MASATSTNYENYNGILLVDANDARTILDMFLKGTYNKLKDFAGKENANKIIEEYEGSEDQIIKDIDKITDLLFKLMKVADCTKNNASNTSSSAAQTEPAVEKAQSAPAPAEPPAAPKTEEREPPAAPKTEEREPPAAPKTEERLMEMSRNNMGVMTNDVLNQLQIEEEVKERGADKAAGGGRKNNKSKQNKDKKSKQDKNKKCLKKKK